MHRGGVAAPGKDGQCPDGGCQFCQMAALGEMTRCRVGNPAPGVNKIKEKTMEEIRIRKGTIITLAGLPFKLVEDTCVKGNNSSIRMVNAYFEDDPVPVVTLWNRPVPRQIVHSPNESAQGRGAASPAGTTCRGPEMSQR